MVSLESHVQSGEVTQNPQVCNHAILEAKKRSAKPVNDLAGRLESSKWRDVATGELHFRKRSVVSSDAVENIASVFCKGGSDHRDVARERVSSLQFHPERSVK